VGIGTQARENGLFKAPDVDVVPFVLLD